MLKFPVACVDDFYDNPDEVRKFALSLDYDNEQNATGFYPGIRTKSLHEIDNKFFDMFCNKMFSVFYDLSNPNLTLQWEVFTTFHKMPSFGKTKNDLRNTGWVHQDPHVILAGVIYLNPNAPLDTGTSMYRIKNPDTFNLENIHRDEYHKKKVEFYKMKDPIYCDTITEEEHNLYNDAVCKNNDLFEETIRVNNVYNRMTIYDSSNWHRPVSYYMDSDEPRLTQVFFVNKLTASNTPTSRIKQFS
jgi:hypothetical protein